MKLRVSEILDATKGLLLKGSLEAVVSGVAIDSRGIIGGELFVPLKGERCDGHLFIEDACKKGARAALIQKEKSLSIDVIKTCSASTFIEVRDPLRALGDLAQFWRKKFTISIVAITGSNGKTTTKEMAWQIVRRRFQTVKNPGNWNNLIGLPLSLLQLTGSEQVGIMELGMSAREEIRRLAAISIPRIGVITNIGPAHLEQLKNIENVMDAKGELFENLGPDDIAIVNRDDTRVASLAKRTRARILSYGLRAGDVRALKIEHSGDNGSAFDLDVLGQRTRVCLSLPPGPHLSNALAAATIAHALQIHVDDIKKGLEIFRAVPGRMEIIDFCGIKIINDTYNANPVSMEVSLRVLAARKGKKRTIAVLGDMLELGETAAGFHQALGQQAAELSIDCLLVTGKFASFVAEGAKAAGMSTDQIMVFADLQKLAEKLAQTIQLGDCILIKGSRAMGMEKVIALLQNKKRME